MFQAATFKILSSLVTLGWAGFFISCYVSRSTAYMLKMCINDREAKYIRKLSNKDILFRYTVLPTVSAISAIIFVPKFVRSDSAEVENIDQLSASDGTTTFLSRRVSSLDSDNYRPGLEGVDVFYPPWMDGKWTAASKFISFSAPLGVEVIGGKAVSDAAETTLESILEYNCSFIKDKNDRLVSDRLYNVVEIARASMGRDSVTSTTQLSDSRSLADELHVTVSPEQSNGAEFDITLLTTDRKQNQPADAVFEAMERSQQVIAPRRSKATAAEIRRPPPPPPLRKDIETITVYRRVSPTIIIADQRTATFLSPQDPRFALAFARQPAVMDSAVEIRNYIVTYTKQIEIM